MPIQLDPWQKEVLEYEGNIALRSGRQVGKSTVVSMKAAEYAIRNPRHVIMIISATERQAQLLFEKTLGYLIDNHPYKLKKGRDRPTKHKVELQNGARIYSLPTGMSGAGIRGYTVNMLIADEAAFINEAVWQAVTPMLAVTKGKIILLSTPFGRRGYFYQRFNDDSFKTWHISSEDCPRADKIFLAQEKKSMSKLQYAQEYLGEFVDELRQFFPTELIHKCMTISKGVHPYTKNRDLFLGVDIARMGEDETVLTAVSRQNREIIRMIDLEITKKTRLTDTIDRIKRSDMRFNYKKIYIDTTGVGGGVYDVLLQDDDVRRKIVSIENASKPLEPGDKRKKRILKEDLYANLLRLMEQGNIELFDNPEVELSLKSVQYEYGDTGRLKLFGRYTHIAEALIRAAWCVQDKTLNIWVRY